VLVAEAEVPRVDSDAPPFTEADNDAGNTAASAHLG
jgi:hypothetical protein